MMLLHSSNVGPVTVLWDIENVAIPGRAELMSGSNIVLQLERSRAYTFLALEAFTTGSVQSTGIDESWSD
jgi:hypothetical protein